MPPSGVTSRAMFDNFETRQLIRRYRWCVWPAALTVAYGLWIELFRLLALSFITFFLLPSSLRFGTTGLSDKLPRFEEITDVLGANELPLIGLSAFLFVILLKLLHPLSSTPAHEVFSKPRFQKYFWPGALHGAVLGMAIALAFALSGLYRYLGFLLPFEEIALALPGLLLRIAAIVAFVYSEEIIFRQKLQRAILSGLAGISFDPANEKSLKTQILAVLITGFLYCGIKALQFDLSWMHFASLLLISIALSLRTLEDGTFERGAGFFAALLVILHPLFSLPVLGNDFSGILMIKYLTGASSSSVNAVARFMTGGAGGPLSGFAFQILILIDILRSAVRYKKTLLQTPAPR